MGIRKPTPLLWCRKKVSQCLGRGPARQQQPELSSLVAVAGFKLLLLIVLPVAVALTADSTEHPTKITGTALAA